MELKWKAPEGRRLKDSKINTWEPKKKLAYRQIGGYPLHEKLF